MQQSVLLTAVRGPDGLPKYHSSKYLLRWYRRCILLSAMDGRVLEIQSTEKDQAKTDQEAAIRLDHSFRNRFQLSHAEMWQGTQMDQDYGLAPRYIKLRTVQFDPVLADGEPPPNYEPHTMPVVDHRRKL